MSERFITGFKIESNGVVISSVDINGKKGVQWLIDPNRVSMTKEDIELITKVLNKNFLPQHKKRVTDKLNGVINCIKTKPTHP